MEPRRPQRQDTFDLRDHLLTDDSDNMHAHADAAAAAVDNGDHDVEPRSVLDDESDGEDGEEYIDDDRSSSLSIPNESIDFDLVYSLHSFAATVEGQANVVKGDRLFLIDDSNSYWWLVRVLKTQEVGYIPAENIETPFERLARLNKHRNVDLASATQAEMQGELNASQDRLRLRTAGQSPSPVQGGRGRPPTGRRLAFTSAMSIHRYAPAIWDEDDDENEDDDAFDEMEYMATDPDLADEERLRGQFGDPRSDAMEVEDDMEWSDVNVDDIQAQHSPEKAKFGTDSGNPEPLQAGAAKDAQPQIWQQQAQAMAQQHQQQAVAQEQQEQLQQQQWATQQQQQKELQHATSKERLSPPDAVRPGTVSPNIRQLDPAEATDTVRRTITPSVARDTGGQVSPQEDERAKRIREEEEAAARMRSRAGKDKPPSPSPSQQKLQKQRKQDASRELEDENANGRKKKGELWSRLFQRKKDKTNKNASVTSFDSGDTRISEDSSISKSSRPSATGSDGVISPTTNLAMQQQQTAVARSGIDSTHSTQAPSTSERPAHVSQHATQLRQHDQQQQELYLTKYLNSSPASAPEVQPSYGLQSASAVLNSYAPGATNATSGLGPPAARPRPGSLILTSTSIDGALPGVQQELSVIRVFAGKNVQTDATFKTALLNSSTIASDLVRQAIQRFRLPGGEDSNDYYLTVKQVEGGSSAVLQDHENPLVVFETLVNEAMEMPKVKRSSMGSISSISSNLSMHPAIKKLPMNDFTDDSAVKFYLNKKSEEGVEDSVLGHGSTDDFATAEAAYGSLGGLGGGSSGGEPIIPVLGDTIIQSPKNQYLTVSTGGLSPNVTSERFSSPSIRFAVQLVIHREDLPDDMAFHPTTEAIIFKDQLRDSETSAHATVNPQLRKKIFMFPRNITVAEVIEFGLERFGILEGVVDGGDEIEDKSTKRRSSTRVRYGLWISINGHDRELTPSSKVVDSFPKPPTFRAPDRMAGNFKRRSVDSTLLLGSVDDVQPDDPVFLLRRATSYRNSTSRHRHSAPLDDYALQKLHRESVSSGFSHGSTDQTLHQGAAQVRSSQEIQEIIAAQREATRANQLAILSAESNSLKGTDVLLLDHTLLRSSRYDSTERMRYSYVEPDGETYDISEIVESEWGANQRHLGSGLGKNDLLATVVAGAGGSGGKNPPGLGANLDRVLNRIRNGKPKDAGSVGLSLTVEGADDDGGQRVHDEDAGDDRIVADTIVVGGLNALRGGGAKRESGISVPSVSEYSVDDSRSATPGSAGFMSRMPPPTSVASTIVASAGVTAISAHTHSRSTSSTNPEKADRSSPILPRASTSTPTGRPGAERRRPSEASVMSDTTSGYVTPPPHPIPPHIYESPRSFNSSTSKGGTSVGGSKKRGPIIPKDDFGISHMMAIIEYQAAQAKNQEREARGEGRRVEKDVNVVDERLFGRPVNLEQLHPHVRDIFEGGFKMLEEMDKVIDSYVQPSIGAF